MIIHNIYKGMFIVILLLMGCSTKDRDTYFPLRDGSKWEYTREYLIVAGWRGWSDRLYFRTKRMDYTDCQKREGAYGHTPAKEECLVAEVLFGGEPAFIYNPWGNMPSGFENNPGYRDGGHSGIDMQTQDVATRRDKPFYSLSPGMVVADGSDSFGTIAIFDSDKDQTILYIHSNSSAVNTGQSVEIGTHLGGQGNKGLNVGENEAIHVHLEVQNGEVTKGADGANSTKEPIAAILEYLVISYSHDFDGIFYNLGIQLGGTVTSTLNIQESVVTGYMNFTNLPGESALCGAGNLSGTYYNGSIVGSFVSNDLDPGCGFDHGSIFYIDANLDSENTHYWGDYQPRNAGGSNIREDPGIFESWISGSTPRRVKYQGTFKNTTFNRSGPVVLDIALGTNTVSGYMNYTNWPGEPAICGAGEFTGVRRSDNTIQYSFISRDPDPDCGFDHGLKFIMDAVISTNLDTISGTYQADRQGGVFSVIRDPSEEVDPLLSISPSTGKQLEVTFEVTGSNFTPNGEVHRFVKFPNEEYQQISTITADEDGEVYWTYTPDCNHPVGDTYIYALDVATNVESNEIAQSVIKNPICQDDGMYAYSFDFPVKPINEWFIYSPSGDFGDYRYINNIWGYHAGEDWNTYKGNIGQPVYAVANGEVAIKSFTESVGGTLVIKHTAPDGNYFVIPSRKIEPPHEYEYDKQLVDKIYSVYIHIGIPDHIEVGTEVIKGEVIGSIIQVPGMGPHLHFEIRGPNTNHSQCGQMLGNPINWAGNGDYKDIQKLVNDGAIKPIQFIAANLYPLSSSLKIGDRIRLTQPRNLRHCPSTDNDKCPPIKLMEEGSIGTLTNESLKGVPETNNGYIWWEIVYDSGEKGWSAQGNPSTGKMWIKKITPAKQMITQPEVGTSSHTHFDDTDLIFTADISESDLITVQYYEIPPFIGNLPETVSELVNYYWKVISGAGLIFNNGKVSVPLQALNLNEEEDITWLKRSDVNETWVDIGGNSVDGNFESTVPFDSFSELTIGYKSVTYAEDFKQDIPNEYKLLQNYPNPFNPSTIIEYNLPKGTSVSLNVYNTLGQRIAILVDEYQHAGRHKVTFDSQDHPSGVYIYRLQADEYVESRKMLYLK